MSLVALIFIGLAALLHVFIFYLEAFAWASPTARNIFGHATEEELAITRFFAYNQGVYNLMLAIVAGIGIAMWLAGHHSVGRADVCRRWFHDYCRRCTGTEIHSTSRCRRKTSSVCRHWCHCAGRGFVTIVS